ncbi:ester cyclase [Acidobacteriota bacterium]
MKKLSAIVSLALILCFMVGCQDKAALAELETIKARAEVEEQNKALILKWYEELDTGNLDKFLELFAPNFIWYSPSNSPTPLSKKETQEYLIEAFKAIKEVTHKIEEIITVNDKVIVRTINSATHEGIFQGIHATGKKVEFSAIAIFQIKDRKVVEVREDSDKLGWFQQLGMELKPKVGE